MFSVNYEGYGQHLKTDAADTEINPHEYISLSHIGRLKIKLSEQDISEFRIIKKCENAKWRATRLEKNRISANFQGDPLWPARTLQKYPKLLEYFSLKESSTETHCILPMSQLINKRLMSILDRPYLFRENKFSTDREYVDAFVDDRVLPMADILSRDSIHDWSYHFLTLLFPEYLENLRLNIKTIREQVDQFKGETSYSWNYYGHELDDKGSMIGSKVVEKMAYKDAIYRQMAISIDVATAKIIQILEIESRGLIEKCSNELKPIEELLCGVNFSALKRILFQEKELEKKIILPKDLGVVINKKPLDYVHQQLSLLNTKAEGLLKPDEINLQKRVFKEVLVGCEVLRS